MPENFSYTTLEGDTFSVPEGYIPDEHTARCRAPTCRRAILWAVTPNRKRAPLDPDGTNHFATCPEASTFRRK